MCFLHFLPAQSSEQSIGLSENYLRCARQSRVGSHVRRVLYTKSDEYIQTTSGPDINVLGDVDHFVEGLDVGAGVVESGGLAGYGKFRQDVHYTAHRDKVSATRE